MDHYLVVFSIDWLFDKRFFEDLTADYDAVVVFLNVSLSILIKDI
jgi:hypothetical protein